LSPHEGTPIYRAGGALRALLQAGMVHVAPSLFNGANVTSPR
jgi:hypothetical protein